MLCCRSQQDYDVEAEEEADVAGKKQANKAKGGKKTKKNDKAKAKEANDIAKENDIVKQVEEVVESPIEVRITEASESAPIEDPEKDEVCTLTDECEKEQSFETQTSVTSQGSVRDTINRSRENFFSCNSLNESHLQEVRRSLSSTDERFTEHCKKLRSQLSSGSGDAGQGHVMSYEQMQQAIGRLEAAAARLEALSVVGGARSAPVSAGIKEELVASPLLDGFDEIVNGKLAEFMKLSGDIGGDVKTQADKAKCGFDAVRNLLVTACKSKKPPQTTLVGLLKPLSESINAVQEFKDANRTSKFINHLQTLAESIPALGWVSVEPAPRAYVKEMGDAGQFYSNRVIKEYKGNDDKHVEWARAWNAIWTQTIEYIKVHHTTGLSWNPQGVEASAAAAAPPPPAGGAPPPPPPPPPAPAPAPASNSSGGDAGVDTSALFAAINRGTAISSGLKKVTDDMKTHKNPALKASSTVPGVRTGPKPFQVAKATAPKTAPKPQQAAADKPPVFELQNKKWVVEYQVGNKAMVIDDTNLKQVIYLYKCRDSTLQVKGKVNSITLDSCKKVAVSFDSVVSCIDVVNSQSIQAQVFGQCPTVSIDKTDGFQMYLSKDSLNTEIVTAKSSEMNILVPKDDGDFAEYALPEQFKTVWSGKKFKTDCTESV